MPILSVLASQAQEIAPINKIPYDVLREIFIHCLPYEARHTPANYEPKPKVAPMLLCQVCASWRFVALGSATLWRYLSFLITVKKIRREWAVRRRDIDFLRWWRKNQGSLAPYLDLIHHWRVPRRRNVDETYYILSKGGIDYVLEYLTSAQYLSISPVFWQIIQERLESGERIVFQHIHTLVGSAAEEIVFHDVQTLLGRVPGVIPQTMRRLYLGDGTTLERKPLPSLWSTLTEISILEIDIDLSLWYNLFRDLPRLEQAVFLLYEILSTEYTPPSTITHASLSSLSVTYAGEESAIGYPLSLLISNIHLSELHTLSLLSYSDSWFDHRAVTELHCVLMSTPNIKTLKLGKEYLSLPQFKFWANPVEVDTPPVWTRTPLLTSLQLELPSDDYSSRCENRLEERLDVFLFNTFVYNNQWLNPGHPSCPIRTITIIDSQLDKIEDFAFNCLNLVAQRCPNIYFHLDSESTFQTDYDAWKEWCDGV